MSSLQLDKNKEKNLFCLSVTNICKLPSLLSSFFLVTRLFFSSFWNMFFPHWTWLLFSCNESLLQAIWKYGFKTEILKDFILQMHCQKDECGNSDGPAWFWCLLLGEGNISCVKIDKLFIVTGIKLWVYSTVLQRFKSCHRNLTLQNNF